MQTCTGQARYFGDLDDLNRTVSQPAKSLCAFRLLEDSGTHPKTIYLQEGVTDLNRPVFWGIYYHTSCLPLNLSAPFSLHPKPIPKPALIVEARCASDVAARRPAPGGLLENKADCLLCLGKKEQALQVLQDALAQTTPGDTIKLKTYTLV